MLRPLWVRLIFPLFVMTLFHPEILFAEAIKTSPHGNISISCEKCHIPTSWTALPERMEFDHAETVFPLEGRHQAVSCQTCHSDLQFDKAASTCAQCHDDPHQRQFGAQCNDCHTPTSWDNRSELELNHSATRFPLIGAHRSVSCQNCHDDGKYVGTSTDCISCHASTYRSTSNPNHVAVQFSSDCNLCHSLQSSDWQGASFTHTVSFPLTAGHNVQDCASCHSSGYDNTPTNCVSCHSSDYNSVTNPNHVALPFPTECQSCHTTGAWSPAQFEHTLARFQLTGAHRAVDCASCHVSEIYTGTSQECFGCHQGTFIEVADPNHVTGGYDPNCISCHSDEAWKPARFDHNLANFPLTGAHLTADCAQCHNEGTFNGTPQECYPCHSVDYDAVTDPNHLEAQFDRNCQTCHSTAVWKPSTFDHLTTDFQLTGAHVDADCASCHSSGQFNGLTTACFDCHTAAYNDADDPSHTASGFTHECTSCHTTVAWEPSSLNHQVTQFPLTGAHLIASCESCHSSGEFGGLATECLACHRPDYESTHDPNHVEKNFDEKCLICHTTNAWKPAVVNHNETDFPLTGAHTFADCKSCHVVGAYSGTKKECQACHMQAFDDAVDPAHIESGFSRNCIGCHKPSRWEDASYDHSLSRFQLTGAHEIASCSACHVGGRYTGTSQECFTCHRIDYEGADQPNHALPQIDHNCAICHATDGWTPSTFNHAETEFPLVGAHQTATCADCHVGGRFDGTPLECYPCHQADFDGVEAPNHRLGQFDQRCLTCHTNDAWTPSTFDHASTDFALVGAHLAVACTDCHINNVYNNTPRDCYPCHQADFNAADQPDHEALQFGHDCTVCHSVDAWEPAQFDHENTDFPLTGAHQQTDCASCHQNGNYNETPTDCYTCHTADYNDVGNPDHDGQQFPRQCLICHTTDNWNSNYDHEQFFPLTNGAHRRGEAWNTCSQCHTNPNDYNVFSCIDCHEHSNRNEVDRDHREVNNYRYTSEGCYDCHPNGRHEDIFQPAKSKLDVEKRIK